MSKHSLNTSPDSGVTRCPACGSVTAKSGDNNLDDDAMVCVVWDVGDIEMEYDCTISEALAWLRKHKDNLDQAAFDALWNYTNENCPFEQKDDKEADDED